MRILITGGSGFIGTNLIDDLRRQQASVVNLDPAAPLCPTHSPYWRDCDILNLADLLAQFRSYRPTHVVHLAARTDTTGKRTLDDYHTNTDGTANVLAAVAACPSVSRLIVASTQFVCRPGYVPQNDRDYSPHTVYGRSKVIGEQLTRKAQLDCAWTIVRPTTIWGPWLLRHRDQFLAVLRRGWYVHPAGKPCIRSWGYVGNLVDQIRKILELAPEKVHGKTLYVGDPPADLADWVNAFSQRVHGRDVRTVPRGVLRCLGLAGDLLQACGARFPITSTRYLSMTEDYPVPIGPTFELLGQPPYSLKEGVEEVFRWLDDTGHQAAGLRPARRAGHTGSDLPQPVSHRLST